MEATGSIPILILPGLGNSGPGHWQTWLEARLPNCHRVEQRDWDDPERLSWIAALERDVGAHDAPALLVGHSLGTLTIVHWAMPDDRRVVGALLVAPTDPESPNASHPCRSFRPVPMRPLSFPSILVASATDPYVTLGRARQFASAWGSRIIELGDAGHINSEAGYGAWPLAEELVAELLTIGRVRPGATTP
jgi:predicted alpha/beta hydrolase family esterase